MVMRNKRHQNGIIKVNDFIKKGTKLIFVMIKFILARGEVLFYNKKNLGFI